MKFKDPIAPRYGHFNPSLYKRRFAWLPLTTHDGYGIWLESYWSATKGAANTSFTSKYKYLESEDTDE